MTPNPAQDELLSAYLDGEVSDAERREVEARLAGDPAAQRLLTELRGAASAVRALPRGHAPVGLSAQIAERLERSMLFGDAAPSQRPSPISNTGTFADQRSRTARWVGWSQWLSCAAVIALTVGVGVIYLRNANIPSSPALTTPNRGRSAPTDSVADKTIGGGLKSGDAADSSALPRDETALAMKGMARSAQSKAAPGTGAFKKSDQSQPHSKLGAADNQPVQQFQTANAAPMPDIAALLPQPDEPSAAVVNAAPTLLVNVADVSHVGKLVNEIRLQAAALKIPPANESQNYLVPDADEQPWIQTAITANTRPASNMVQSNIDVCAPVEQLQALVGNVSQAPAAMGCSIEFNALGQKVNSWKESQELVQACAPPSANDAASQLAYDISAARGGASVPLPPSGDASAARVQAESNDQSIGRQSPARSQKSGPYPDRLIIGNDADADSEQREASNKKEQKEQDARQWAKSGDSEQRKVQQEWRPPQLPGETRNNDAQPLAQKRGGALPGQAQPPSAATQWNSRAQYRSGNNDNNDSRRRNAILRITVQAPATGGGPPPSSAPQSP